MWAYVKGRWGEKRREAWVWTAVIEDAGGRRGVDLVVGATAREHFCGGTPGCRRRDGTVLMGIRFRGGGRRTGIEVGKGGAVNWNAGLHRGCGAG